MENEKDDSEVQKTTEEVDAETTETSELTPEEIAELKKKADVSSQNFERAKKAEAELKAARDQLKAQAPSEEKPDQLSLKDQAFIAKADIHEDDIDEVLDWARFKKIPVKEAYKQLKPTFEVKAEQRKTAETANLAPSRRGPTKVTDDTLLEKAKKGDLPDSDEEIQRLVGARYKTKQ